MSAAEALQNIEAHLRADYESVKARIEQDLPVVADVLTKAESSPVIAALSAAVHIPAAPEALQLVVNFISGLDAAIGAAKAQAAAEAAAPPDAPTA